ncbi:MAG TPA: MarR family transcriptional regulator [Steroidobacteraceae bacterium]
MARRKRALAARRKKGTRVVAARKQKGRARTSASERVRWMPEVGPSGELYLRRTELTARPDRPDEMNYPFAQGLTFVARRWRNLMNEELRAIGQSQARWGVLYWIDVFGDSVNQTELADRIGVEQPTLGRLLMDLEREGLIERRPVDSDKRAKTIRLTPAARPLMREINRIQERVRARLLKGIDPKDLTVCLSVFARILANFDQR